MKVRTRVVLVLAMIAALLGITSGAGAQVDEGATEPAADVERNIVPYEPENAASLRESLAFPEVPSERLLLEANKNASVEEYGEPFLDSELEEIKLRVWDCRALRGHG